MKRTKEITIGFSKPRGLIVQPLSWIIRTLQKSDYSHTYIKLRNNKLKNELYYHASGSKVHFMNGRAFNKKNKIVEDYVYRVPDDSYYKALDFAIDKVGTPYSFSQLFGFLIVKLVAAFGKEISNPFGKNGLVCSELDANMLREVFGKIIDKDIDSITPTDVRNFLRKQICLVKKD